MWMESVYEPYTCFFPTTRPKYRGKRTFQQKVTQKHDYACVLKGIWWFSGVKYEIGVCLYRWFYMGICGNKKVECYALYWCFFLFSCIGLLEKNLAYKRSILKTITYSYETIVRSTCRGFNGLLCRLSSKTCYNRPILKITSCCKQSELSCSTLYLG